MQGSTFIIQTHELLCIGVGLGLFGINGGIIAIPMSAMGFGMPQIMAQGLTRLPEARMRTIFALMLLLTVLWSVFRAAFAA